MASGSFSSNTGVSCNVRVTYWTSTDISSNTSNVTMTAYLDYNAPLYMNMRTLTFNCNGVSHIVTTSRISDSSRAYRQHQLGAWTTSVRHNDDGSKSCYIGISIPLNVTYSRKYIGTLSPGGTVSLDNIPRKAMIDEASDFEVENEHFITFTTHSSSFWYRLRVSAWNDQNHEWQLISIFENYSSGKHIRFNKSEIALVYKIGMPYTNVGSYVEFKYHLETWVSNGQGYIGEDTRVVKGYISGNMFVNVNNIWKKCVPFINVNGTWKPCVPYINVLGSWK